MVGEVIDLRGGIDKQDRPIHTCGYDLAGELKTLLPGGSKDMDVTFILLDSTEVQRDRGRPSGAVRFDMLRFRIESLNQSGLTCPKSTKNNNF